MSQTTRSTNTSGSHTQTSSPARVKNTILKADQDHRAPSGSCAKCSGLFIREHVVGIGFSGCVMRCVNCGATEFLPIGPW